MDATLGAELKSWISVSPHSDFPIHNIPFGIFKTQYLSPVAGVAIGNYVVDLVCLHEQGYLDGLGLPAGIFNQPYLNSFIGLGRKRTGAVRLRIIDLLREDNQELQSNVAARELAIIPMEEVQMQMPVHIPNYTDFYSSEEHATNVGTMFRDPKNALLPNWKHIPVGYHGRASSIVVSGTPIHRPKGQMKSPESETPHFGASHKLDFELEMAFVTCCDTPLGTSLTVEQAEENIFGMLLFNDWSARDIQQWEYVPLGPFLGKNFASTISPWIVTLDALETFRTAGPVQSPKVLPYLEFKGNKNLDINLEVFISANGQESLISQSNFKYMYWNMAQQLAHHTVNGCNIQVGDLYASGTISGPSPGSYGSLLELSWNGQKPLSLADGSERKFLADGDEVILRGVAVQHGVRIGFGECRGKILPALP